MDSNIKPVQHNQQQNQAVDLRDLLTSAWRLKWYIAFSVAICLTLAYGYTRIRRAQFTCTSKIMLVNIDNSNAAESAILSQITGVRTRPKILNEIEIIKSRTMMQRVVEELSLNYWTEQSRPFKTVLFDTNPFAVTYNGVMYNPKAPSASFTIVPIDNDRFTLCGANIGSKVLPYKDTVLYFNQSLVYGEHIFKFEIASNAVQSGAKYFVKMCPSLTKATALANRLSVNTSKVSSAPVSDILSLDYVDELPSRGEKILSTLVRIYNDDSRTYSNQATARTISFLDDRLATIEGDLNSIEGNYREYARRNTLANVDSQTQLALSSGERQKDELTSVQLQIEILGIVRDCINSMNGESDVIPANIGISDTGLNSTITKFNEMVMERNRLAANSSTSNPLVIAADKQIKVLLESIVSSVENLERSYRIQEKQIAGKLRETTRQIESVPTQKMALSDISRKQQIKEPLYILLQQKREEAMVSYYSAADYCRVIDESFGTSKKTYPRTQMILILALLVGICIPPALMFLIRYFKTKVFDLSDIEANTATPIIGTVPYSAGANKLIREDGRSPFEESIRLIRSNTNFIQAKVFMVTSSVPSEGKSFISSNLAAAESYSGKKILLIGCDLRKPALKSVFGVDRSVPVSGVVEYLIGKETDLDKLIVKSINGLKNLDVMFSGTVPPNPAELLESPKMAELIEKVRARDYDMIFIDSAPLTLVADSTIISQYVDSTIFVFRQGVTDIRFLRSFDEIIRTRGFQKVAVVFNAYKRVSNLYGYGYGYGDGYGTHNYYGYGYGGAYYGGRTSYGYGYGYAYGEKTKKKHIKE